MSKIYGSVEELVGSTPLLELKNIQKEFSLKARLFAKLEYLNPGGSVKDRAAIKMIDDAEREGKLKKNSVIIEPTSGNTGIGLAMICAIRGYRLIITMPETMSKERRQTMSVYGAELVLTEGKKGMQGAIEKAEELAAQIPGSFIPGQFVNPSNAKAHFETTGPEIFEALDGDLDIFVAGVGTGGTITGTGRYLKSKNKDIKIVAAEPKSSPVLSGGKPGPHGLQGIGAGFVPEILDKEVIDEVLTVKEEDAYSLGRMLAQKEGILVGISSGAALWASIEMAKRQENEGKNIVVLLPDTGARYLSTDMFNV